MTSHEFRFANLAHSMDFAPQKTLSLESGSVRELSFRVLGHQYSNLSDRRGEAKRDQIERR